jgi:hypothetical protein
MTREEFDTRVLQGKAWALYCRDIVGTTTPKIPWEQLPERTKALYIKRVRQRIYPNSLLAHGWQIYTDARPPGSNKYYAIAYRLKTVKEQWSKPEVFLWENHWRHVHKHSNTTLMIKPIEGIF